MIREFYRGRCVLLTGATGFLGKAVAVKMLRDLPEVERLYVPIRARRQPDGGVISARERLEEELLGGSVFARFRREDPDGFAAVCAKVIPVEWDLMAPGLGLAEEERARMLAEVDLVIGNAATVSFDEPLDVSLQVNTLGPQGLLEFARQCRKKVVFVQVSTAYVNGLLSGSIPERPLPLDRHIRQMIEGGEPDAPFDPEAEIEEGQTFCREIYERAESTEQQEIFRREILAQNHDRKLSEKRLAKLMDDRCKRWIERRLVDEGMRRAQVCGWHDVYTYTKGMGEQMLVKRHGDIPLAIVRPSIIESSLQYPEPGWIYGLKVADPLIVSFGRGLVPDFPARKDVALDLVPVDIVVNTILAAATQARAEEVEVFQAATSSENPLMIARMYDYVREYFEKNPLLDRRGQAPELQEWKFPSLQKFRRHFLWRYMYPLQGQLWLFDRLPERLVPTQKKRRLAALEKRLKRVLYFTDLFGPYTNLECSFEIRRSRALFESLPPDERRLFAMDIDAIEWREYFHRIHLPGLRRHVLKEEPEEEGLREAPEEVGREEERWRIEESIRTIPALLHWACSHYAERPALQIEEKGGWRRYTYGELQERADGLAQRWQQCGLKGEERVLLWGGNSPEWVCAYMGAATLGLTVVPLDPQVREEEVWEIADFTGARALIASDDRLACLDAGAIETRREREEGFHCFSLEECGEGEPLPVEAEWEPPLVAPDQIASIIFTSGMAVEPRGVMLSHRNFIANLLDLAEVHRVYDTDQVLSLLPLQHALEFTGGLLMPLLGGATITYLRVLNSREILRSMRQTGTTALLTVPRLLKVIADRLQRLSVRKEGRGSPEMTGLSRLRLVVSGGAPLAREVFDLFAGWGVRICEGYGLTEAAPIVSVNPPDGVRPGSVGQALPGVEIRIAEEDGKGEGEILVRGANVTSGYYGQPELSQQLLKEGWLRTGDIGRLDGEGYLYITGRSKNLIVTGGAKNVFPEEVEALYGGLPHVAELSVVGIPSERTLGEEVHGVAVLERSREQERDEEKLEQKIREESYRISRSLPGYQRIQHLHLWRRPLPRLNDGEVDRAALLAQLRLEAERMEKEGPAGDLPAWERAIYRQIGRLSGLSTGEVIAHAEAPLDTLLDSLMAVEFVAWLEKRLDLRMEPIDRSEQSLRQVLAPLEEKLAGGAKGEEEEEGRPFWTRTLVPAEGEAAGPGMVKRLLQGIVWGAGSPLFKQYFSLRVRGLEQLPQDRPYLLAANHASHLDAVAVLLAVRPHVDHCHIVAASEYVARSPLHGWLMCGLANGVPFDRQGDFAAGLVQARALVGERRPLLIFPEGTRSPSGQLQPFKSGIGLLAYELGVPIVPVHIRGTYQAMPRGQHHPGRYPIHLLFGPLVETEPFGTGREGLNRYEIYREIVEALRRDIERLAAQNI